MWNSAILFFSIIIIQNNSNGLNLPFKSQRVCVIGAGYSGLGTARYLQQYGLNFTVFEATNHIGGNWRFDPHIGHDDDGVPVFSNMYKGLRTNTPRQTMEYLDFPMSQNLTAFPAGLCFYKYLIQFSKHYHLLKHVKFRSLVNSIKWNHDRWDLTYINSGSKNKTKEVCDSVIVATGYFGKPNVPYFDGQENFKGNIIHSHDYKDEKRFIGRKVVIVGDGPSGTDLAGLLSDFTSKLILSHHHTFEYSELPETVILKPDIKLFKSEGIFFEDDSFEEVDDVILCTGFGYDHDFLDRNTGLAFSPKILMPLHNNIVNIKHPTMMFIGKTKTPILKLYDAQAEYAAALAAHKFQLPDEETMIKMWLEQVYLLLMEGFSINDINSVTNVGSYFKHLTEESGVYRPLPNVEEWLQEFDDNITYGSTDEDCSDIS